MTNVTQKTKKCNTNVNDNVDCKNKTKPLQVYLTLEDYAIVKAKADALRLKVATYVRYKLLN